MNIENIILFVTERRKELGLSQNDVAKQIGYTSQLVFNWEKGKSLPDLSCVIDLCKVLKISIEEFFNCKINNNNNKDKENKSFDIENFATNLKKYRVINNYTQNDLANKLGVSYATIIAWEKAKSTPNLIQFIKIKELYNLSYSELYFGVFEKPKNNNKKIWLSVISALSVVVVGLGTWGIITLVNNNNDNQKPIHDPVVATFFDNDKETIIWGKTFNKNDPLYFGGKVSDKSDGKFDYKFLGWDFNGDGEADDINMNITSNLNLIACYNAISKEGNEDYEFETLGENEVAIQKYNGNDSKIIIPNMYGAKKVTKISNTAFKDNSTLTEVIISDGVITLGGSSFYNCSKLTKVVFPTIMYEIGPSAFSGCLLLNELKMPNTLNYLSSQAFKGCSSLINFDVPNGVSIVQLSAFESCTNLETISFPNTITTMTSSYLYTKIKKIDLPNSVKYIENNSFMECNSLEEVYLNDGVISIGNTILLNDNNVKFVVIPKSVKTWKKATINCGATTSINIFYKGNLEDLKTINFSGTQVIDYDNLDNIYLYSETPAPQSWHFVDNIPTIYEF